MIVINTRPKDLSKKINELCSLEKIELQNTHLSKIIPIKIDTNNGANKKIFENFNTYTGEYAYVNGTLKDGDLVILGGAQKIIEGIHSIPIKP